nr:hypothetical protein [Tanacetum cinerariifolium]
MDLSDIEVLRVFVTCRSILQLVLLGVEDRRPVPNWILSDPISETDTKSYSIEGFAWAFKSFRAAADDYYTRYRRHPRIVAWSAKHKFYRNMLKPMLHGQLPVERLVPDETEARSRWWVSSRAYFDGHSFEDEQVPRHLNRNNYFEVPSKMYREFEEQRRGYQQIKEKNADMYEKITRFIEDMRWVPEANTTPIIADQHFGGVLSAFHTLANNDSFFNIATPLNLQTLNQSNWLSPSNWQKPNPSYLGVYANKRWGSSLGDLNNKLD